MARAMASPAATAIVAPMGTTTYGELLRSAQAVARALLLESQRVARLEIHGAAGAVVMDDARASAAGRPSEVDSGPELVEQRMEGGGQEPGTRGLRSTCCRLDERLVALSASWR